MKQKNGSNYNHCTYLHKNGLVARTLLYIHILYLSLNWFPTVDGEHCCFVHSSQTLKL